MKKVALIILALSLCLHFCAKREKTEKSDKEKTPMSNPISNSGEAIREKGPEYKDQLIIKNVSFNTENLSSDTDLTATPVLQNQDMEDVEYQFRWLVNNQEIPGVSGNILEKKSFKKNDWIYCLVKAVKDDRVSTTFRSDYIRVPNSPPVIIFAPLPKFAVPGIFSYQVQAIDIDQDELTYRILAPLDQGINIDAKSGLITWNIDRNMAEHFTAPVKISFEVSDTDGAKAYSTITITFTSKKNNLGE